MDNKELIERAKDFASSGDSYTGPEVRLCVSQLTNALERAESSLAERDRMLTAVAVPDEPYELRVARLESARNAACEAYFDARHDSLNTITHQRIFEAAFERGWDSALATRQPSAQVPDDVVRDAERYRWMRDVTGEVSADALIDALEQYGEEFDKAIDAAMLSAAARKGEV